MSGRFKKHLGTLRILISILFIYLIVRNVDITEAISVLPDSNIRLFILAAIFLIFQTYLQGVRLYYFTTGLGDNKSQFAKLSFVSSFYNNILPGSTGGDLYKIYFFKRNGLSLKHGTSISLLDRVVGLKVLFIMSICSLYFDRVFIERLLSELQFVKLETLLLAIGLFFLVLLIGFVLIFRSRLFDKLKIILKSYFELSTSRAIKIILISCANWLLAVFSIQLLMIGFDLEVLSCSNILQVLLVVTVIALIPSSFGSIGVREGVMVFCLVLLGIPESYALGISILFRFIIWIRALIGFAIYQFNFRTIV